MFPIRDHNPSHRTPFVTWALIVINIGIFVSYWSLLSDDMALARFFYRWGLVPIASTPETYVTSMFLHGSIMHIAGNMLFLWVFGDNLEDQMGHVGFLLFYLAGGLAAAVAQVAADPSSTVPMVGASGAIAAVMGGYLLMFPRARVDILIILIIVFRIIPVPAWIVLSAWFGLQLLQGTTVPVEGGGVAYWAHAGGFVAGLVLTVPLWRKRGGMAFWRRHEGHPPHPEARYQMVRTSVPTVRRRRKPGSPWGR
jgi:membrane associated rhomboid family serine protease